MRKCGFEMREKISTRYYSDPRWKKVKKLRKENKDIEANFLVLQIRESYNL